MHELGHFVDWMKLEKPDNLKKLTEQAAYDFLRNNNTRWRSLNEAERDHANMYLLKVSGLSKVKER